MQKTPITSVSCQFPGSSSAYTFLVPAGMTVPVIGQFAMVYVRKSYAIVNIVGLNPSLDPNAPFDYKPLTGLVVGFANSPLCKLIIPPVTSEELPEHPSL
jgi:hypothetical protein